MISLIYIGVSLFLDNLFNNILSFSFNNLSFFTSMFSLTSLILLFFLIKNKYLFLLISLLIGLTTDILYNGIFINSILYLFVAIIIMLFFKNKNINVLTAVIIIIITEIVYEGLFFFYIIISNSNYIIGDLLYKVSRSFFANLIYLLISYWVFNKSLKKAIKNNSYEV